MQKKYIVRLSDEERQHLEETIKKLRGSGQRVHRAQILLGEQEAKIIALRLSSPPAGYGNWSLRLLTRHVIELAIVESVSHETLRKMLKKTV